MAAAAVDAQQQQQQQRGPLFQPFRALGYITEEVPFAVQRRGKETYVTVSVGRTWQVNGCSLPALRCTVCHQQLCCDPLCTFV
jgi:hypothetical protein